MTNKMVARDLSYELGLPSHGNSKLVKWRIKIKTTFHSSSLVYGEGFLLMRHEWYHFQQEPMVSKTVIRVFR